MPRAAPPATARARPARALARGAGPAKEDHDDPDDLDYLQPDEHTGRTRRTNRKAAIAKGSRTISKQGKVRTLKYNLDTGESTTTSKGLRYKEGDRNDAIRPTGKHFKVYNHFKKQKRTLTPSNGLASRTMELRPDLLHGIH